MRRRALLATCAAVGVAGCLGGKSPVEAQETTERSDETSEDAQAPVETQESDSSPTDDPSQTDTPSATATPDHTATETERAPTDSPTPTGTPIHSDYETTEVRIVTPDGEDLASVTAAIADTQSLRYTGLSETESLPEDRGMLFVYDEVGEHTYVMRDMDFGIDIVFADDEGVITRIHHAPKPGPDEDGEDHRYPGRGRYVLEVNYEFTEEHGVEEGDILEFDL